MLRLQKETLMNTQLIWQRFSDQLLGFIKTRINDKVIAEDILQDVFIKIHLNLHKIKEEHKITSWLYQITRNTIIDYYRSKKQFDELAKIEDITLTEEQALNQNFIKCMTPFIAELPDKYQQAIVETALGNMSQKDYAENENISYSAAKSRVQRARTALKDLVYNCCALEADKYGNIINANKDDCNC